MPRSSLVSIGATRLRQRGVLKLYLTMPVIYGMVVPIACLDVSVQVYQHVCFWAYGIPRVERRRFLNARHRGVGLPWYDRLHCRYCAYANGVILFAQNVIAETEKYWCPIRHLAAKGFIAPAHQKNFVYDGDLKALKKKLLVVPTAK